jgi:hypothetical protein
MRTREQLKARPLTDLRVTSPAVQGGVRARFLLKTWYIQT